ncbi:Scr1 family TA system antitoxin-like transcriptional regulator [Streptomyces uncialis]|uniref:Scr1 family TA system antitoxin-like transcriptional regulator n=1 Tax=Streptomyces uncialis TaxID=1048205 RepID=UPI0037BC24A1
MDDVRARRPRPLGVVADCRARVASNASYAREIFRVANPRAAADEIRALIRARMTHQELFRRACPPDFSTVLCESVIRRGVGGAQFMREQLSLLLSHGKRPPASCRSCLSTRAPMGSWAALSRS